MDGGKDLIICSFGDEYIADEDNIVAQAAERLECSYENFAEEDCTNNRIQIEVTKRAIQFGHEDVIFVIGWTDPARLDAEHDGKYFSYQQDKTEYPTTIINKLQRYNDYLFDDLLISQKWAAQVYGVQQLLESKNIKYVMFNIHKNLSFNRYNEKVIRNLDHKKYHDCISIKSTLLENDATQYSKFISKKIRTLGYVERP